jgi:hypothetical protein
MFPELWHMIHQILKIQTMNMQEKCCIYVKIVRISVSKQMIDMTKTTYDSRSEAVLGMIAMSKLNKTELSKKTGLNRSNFYRWADGTITNISDSTAQLIAGKLGFILIMENGGFIVSDETDINYTIQAQAITIGLLQDKIAALEKELMDK